MGFEDVAYRYAIKNAFQHSGKADLSAVVGKVIALKKDLDFVSAMPKIKQIVSQVNSMPFEQVKAEFEKFSETGYELKPQEKAEGLPPLEWAEKGEQVITRYAPNPSAVMHIGHARQAVLDFEYAEKYNGKFLLRFDDTDPKVKKPMPMQEARKLYLQDLEWLGVKKIANIFFASDRLERYHEIASTLVGLGKAYVCNCEVEHWRELTRASQACPCRELLVEEQKQRWAKMLSHVFKEGQAVLRIKTDLDDKDPSIRDWWLAKIVDVPDHPNPSTKEVRVWPSYNLACAVDDHDFGITLIFRGQEHAQNATKQKWMFDYLGWNYPHAIHTGRIKLEGSLMSKSKIKAAIEAGELSGFDDPRVATIQALRKRGISPNAVVKMLLGLGINANDATISVDALYDANRKIIDPESDRISFIEDSVTVDVQFSPKFEAKIHVHPDFPERGEKLFSLSEGSQSFIVSRKELEKVKVGEIFRLRNAYNAKLVDFKGNVFFAHFTGFEKINKTTLVWLLPGEHVDVEITMDDAEKVEGIAEPFLLEKKQGERVLLEKFGYCVIDSKGKDSAKLMYTHK